MSHFGTMTRGWDLVPAALSILGQVAKPSPPVGIARRGTGLPQTRLADLGMCIGSIIVYAVIGILTVFGLYYAAASPPLHLAYDVAPSAGPSTIYVPGRKPKRTLRMLYILYFHLTSSRYRWWLQWILVSSWLFAVP
jgi:hypothetical protein